MALAPFKKIIPYKIKLAMDVKKIITELRGKKFKFIICMLHLNGDSKQRIHDLAKFEIEALILTELTRY